MIKRILLVMLTTITLLAACQPAYCAANGHGQRADRIVSEASGSSPVTGETYSEKSEKGNTAEERMLNDLADYIYRCETIYGDLLWVLDYFEKFNGDKTWENLQFARAALADAKLYVSAYSLSESQMSREDQRELLRRGIDVSFLESRESDFKNEQTTTTNFYNNLQYGIMDGVFLEDHWELSMQLVTVLKELTACDIQYLANEADWVLASLNDDELTEKFCSLTERYCPMTRACQASVLKSSEKIEEETADLLDQIDALLLERAGIIGAHENRRNKLKELLEKEEYASIGENLAEISEMPFTLSYPSWYDDEDYFYYWKEDGEVVGKPAPGTALERIPDGCQITINGVKKQELLDYQTELETSGLTSIGSTEKDGKLTALYEHGDSKFALIWEDNNATILMTENPVCLVPGWYFPAQKAAK